MCNMCRHPALVHDVPGRDPRSLTSLDDWLAEEKLVGGPYFPEQEVLEGERYWPPYWWCIVLLVVVVLVMGVVDGEFL